MGCCECFLNCKESQVSISPHHWRYILLSGGLPLCIKWWPCGRGRAKHAQGGGSESGVSFSGPNKHIQGTDMAVTSPLVPPSHPRGQRAGATTALPQCHGNINVLTRGQGYWTRHILYTHKHSHFKPSWLRHGYSTVRTFSSTVKISVKIGMYPLFRTTLEVTFLRWKAADSVHTLRLHFQLSQIDQWLTVLAPSSSITFHQRGGGLAVFNSISGYPCCCFCSFWQTSSCHQH